jgi:hypothetical protein
VVTVSESVDARSIPDPIRPLSPRERAWWDRLWRSPAAALWCESDVAAVTRLVVLETTEGLDAKVLAELRQLEDRLLLNPWARRVAKVEVVADKPESVRKSSGRSRAGALKVVTGGAA